MALPRLIVITDWSLPAIERQLSALKPLGDEIAIQHRAPEMAGEEFRARARWLATLNVPLFINGRPDVAEELRADLHLPESGAFHRHEGRLSVAFHRDTPAQRAHGADLALVSPVFAPLSKPEDTRPPLGPDGFERIARSLPCPAYALGGITAANVRQLPSAAGVAVISSILKAADPLKAARDLLAALPRRP